MVATPDPFLTAPPPVRVFNADAPGPLVLLCDHGGTAIPEALGDLGLPSAVRADHVAHDPGTLPLTEALSTRLGVPAVISTWSRLVIDCNRPPGAPDAIPAHSDGHAIPGNQNLTAHQRTARLEAGFHPYHRTIDTVIARLRHEGRVPWLLSLHSFTPCLNTARTPRPWHAGVLWDRDSRLPRALIDALRADQTLVVGDNEPYSGVTHGYTLQAHAAAAGLAHAALEIRNDLLATEAGLTAWSERLIRLLGAWLAENRFQEVCFGSH